MRLTQFAMIGCIAVASASCKSSTTSSNATNSFPPPGESAKTDQEKLQGVWTVISLHEEGKPQIEAKGRKIKFEGDQCSSVGETDRQMTFKLDSSKTPRQIDLISPQEPKVVPGIYEIDGDNLKVALGVYREIKYSPGPGEKLGKQEIVKGDRPTAFGGKLTEVFVLKRGDVAVPSNEENYRKLVVGVWKWRGGSYPTFIFGDLAEFTVDGKLRIKRNNNDPWKDHGKYEIKGDYIMATVPEPVAISKTEPPETIPSRKFKDRDYKHVINLLDETKFETDYFRLERVK